MTYAANRPQVDAGRLWAGGAATALVAALVAVVGVLVCQNVFDVVMVRPPLIPVGNSFTVRYAITAAVLAILATALGAPAGADDAPATVVLHLDRRAGDPGRRRPAVQPDRDDGRPAGHGGCRPDHRAGRAEPAEPGPGEDRPVRPRGAALTSSVGARSDQTTLVGEHHGVHPEERRR
jgi:hypothetical protein